MNGSGKLPREPSLTAQATNLETKATRESRSYWCRSFFDRLGTKEELNGILQSLHSLVMCLKINRPRAQAGFSTRYLNVHAACGMALQVMVQVQVQVHGQVQALYPPDIR